MNGKTQRRLEHLFLLHAHPEGEEQPWDVPRQLARELHPASLHEQVHDREVEDLTAGGRHRLRPAAHHVDAVPLPSQDDGEGPSACEIPIHEEDEGHCLPASEQWTYHAPSLTTKDLRRRAGTASRPSDRDSDV